MRRAVSERRCSLYMGTASSCCGPSAAGLFPPIAPLLWRTIPLAAHSRLSRTPSYGGLSYHQPTIIGYDPLLTVVLGLSTALQLSERGLRIAVLARELPSDLQSSQWASPWAGANWSSFASNPAEQRRDTLTFEYFGRLAQSNPEIVVRRPFKYIWNKDIGYSSPWYKSVVGDFRPLEDGEKVPGFSGGVRFDSFTLNPHRLLGMYEEKLRARGVPLIRARLNSLADAFRWKARLVINASGLGARAILGVEDSKVFPDRGQTVLVRAPSVQTCYGVRDANNLPGEATYIIPRPGSGGCVVVGGTNLRGESDLLPRKETAERILEKAFKICPGLAEGGKSWRDIRIVSHNVGLRPCREGGLRLELEHVDLSGERDLLAEDAKESTQGTVLHCYGIGPAGYQAHHGIAVEAADMALEYLGQKAKL